jgi:glycosyltransferase involved in cell wall biosynthesis
LEHLAQRGHTSLLFAPKGAPPGYAKTKIVRVPGIPSLFYPDLKLSIPFVNVRPRLAAFKPDVVHLVNPVFLGPAALRAARGIGVPVLASYQTDLSGFFQRWGFGALGRIIGRYLRWLHNQMDLNVAPSRFTRDQLVAKGYQRVKVWDRGVDTVSFHPDRYSLRWRRRLTKDEPAKPLMLYVGRLSLEKRVDWLRPVIDSLPRARLAIVGDGPARPALENLFENTPTVFTGFLHGDELCNAYAAADVFVFAGANETLGNVVLEAMASGLPVVAPRSGGLVDHVQSEKNGLLFDAEDQDALVKCVQRLVRDPVTANRLGHAGRGYVEDRDWQSTLDSLLDDYASLRKTLPTPISE